MGVQKLTLTAGTILVEYTKIKFVHNYKFSLCYEFPKGIVFAWYFDAPELTNQNDFIEPPVFSLGLV